MPKAGDLQQVVPPPISRQKGVWQNLVKAWPVGAASSCYAIAQAIRTWGKFGLTIDPDRWQALSVGAAAAVFLISAAASLITSSPVVVLGLRIMLIRFYLACHLITPTSYLRMRKAIERSFEERIARRD